MKKISELFIVVLFLLILASCAIDNETDNITAYAVVYHETDLFGELTGKIVFGTKSNNNNQKSDVYHYNSKSNKYQLQPSKYGSVISNIDAPWKKVESFTLEGYFDVYYKASTDKFNPKYELINESKIQVFKITSHNRVFNTIYIDEIYAIRVEDVAAFEFNYEIEELK